MNGFDCLNTIRYRSSANGPMLELTEEQKELAYSMARIRLLLDPKVAERLRELQSEAFKEVYQMVIDNAAERLKKP